MQILFHELEHANQISKIKNSKSIESAILTITSKVTNISDNAITNRNKLEDELSLIDKNYHSVWEYAPHERLAEYHSYVLLIMILKNFDTFDSKFLKEYYSLALDMQLFIKYGNICPTEYYLEKMGFINSWSVILDLLKRNKVEEPAKYILGLTVSDEFLDSRRKVVKDKILSLKKSKLK